LTWLLYNLQRWRHRHWFQKFTVHFLPFRKDIVSSMYNNKYILTSNHQFSSTGEERVKNEQSWLHTLPRLVHHLFISWWDTPQIPAQWLRKIEWPEKNQLTEVYRMVWSYMQNYIIQSSKVLFQKISIRPSLPHSKKNYLQ